MRDAGRELESLLVECHLQKLRRAPSEHWTVTFWDSPIGEMWELTRGPVESQIFFKRENPGCTQEPSYLECNSSSLFGLLGLHGDLWSERTQTFWGWFFPSLDVTLFLFPVHICSSGIKPVLIIWLIILHTCETVCWRRWRTRLFSPYVPSDSLTSQLCDFRLIT